jgi:histidyl-tRNA synthetase
MKKPKLPKGTRDFLPDQMLKRNYIFKQIQNTFERFGYQPIETPAMEDLSTLTGKYGEEGDRLLFKVLNNGDFLSKVDTKILEEKDSDQAISQLSKRGLRYDLTVPFARFVVMNQNELQFPFKRYQIQPVWRADRPQKGRYQEFYQCDVDVVGSKSLVYEAELIQIYQQVFKTLNLDIDLRINNRKILIGLAEYIDADDKIIDLTTAIDKLDKIGIDSVFNELEKYGFTKEQISSISDILKIESLIDLKAHLQDIPVAIKGIQELHAVYDLLKASDYRLPRFDITLARGLNYYTGCIFEVNAKGVKMGSIGGGGRYDNLTEIFGLKDMSGVGISFGAERIYDVMEELDLFPEALMQQIELLIIALDDASLTHGFGLVSHMRARGVSCDLYPDVVKMKKSMKYANARKVPYVLIIGEREREEGQYVLKNMESGKQQLLGVEKVVEMLLS